MDGSPTGRDPNNRVVIKTLEVKVDKILLGCKCLVSEGVVVQEQYPLVKFPRRISFKISFNCTRRDEQYSGLIVWRLEDNQCEDADLIIKSRGEEFLADCFI
jgi:hypothetical protein